MVTPLTLYLAIVGRGIRSSCRSLALIQQQSRASGSHLESMAVPWYLVGGARAVGFVCTPCTRQWKKRDGDGALGSAAGCGYLAALFRDCLVQGFLWLQGTVTETVNFPVESKQPYDKLVFLNFIRIVRFKQYPLKFWPSPPLDVGVVPWRRVWELSGALKEHLLAKRLLSATIRSSPPTSVSPDAPRGDLHGSQEKGTGPGGQPNMTSTLFWSLSQAPWEIEVFTHSVFIESGHVCPVRWGFLGSKSPTNTQGCL